jgi:hypothetical protein
MLRRCWTANEDGEEEMEICEFDIPSRKANRVQENSARRGYPSETWNDRLFREKIGNIAFVSEQPIAVDEERHALLPG